MKIESYEPFHIGSKFKYYVDKGHLLAKLYDYYEANMEEGFELNPNILKGDGSFTPVLNIITNPKEKITIQMNLSSNALNVIGNDTKKTVDLFIKLMKSLPDLGFEINSTFSFYEIITNVILLLETEVESPNEIFGKFSSNIFDNIEDLPNLKVNHIRFSDEMISKETEERFNLEILPNRTSPKKRIIFKILKRVKNYELLFQFQEKLEVLIKSIFEQLVK